MRVCSPRVPGYAGRMSDYTEDEIEAIRAVVDRVTSWQDGATEGTVESELREGFDEVGVEVSPEHLEAFAAEINEDAGDVSVERVLSS
jgi:hypothetical protein